MVRGTRAEWEKRVRRWKSSGLTAARFAQSQGLNPRTLTWWSSQLRRPDAPTAPTFVEVVAPMEQPQNALEVKVGELLVVVPVGFDEETLRRLVRALGKR